MEIIQSVVPTQEEIVEAQKNLAKLPQIEIKTEHYFLSGVYTRKIYLPQTALVVGKKHRKDHLFLCIKGHIKVLHGDDVLEMREGDILEAKGELKKVVYAFVDSIVVNVHRTENTDLDIIEEELLYPEPDSPYDSGNKLKESYLKEIA
jgi:hypothetical protein